MTKLRKILTKKNILKLLLEAKAFHLIGETPLFLENGQNDHIQMDRWK